MCNDIIEATCIIPILCPHKIMDNVHVYMFVSLQASLQLVYM